MYCNDKPVHLADQPVLRAIVQACTLCNESDLYQREDDWQWRGDTVDIALLAFGEKLGCRRAHIIDTCPQVNGIPYEPESQFAATCHTVDDGFRTFVKGAPERILAMCGDGDEFANLETVALEMAEKGLRVLAIADGDFPEGADSEQPMSVPSNLEFLGFVGTIDPLRPGARDAVATCQRAGVSVNMITGDHRATALAVARELALAQEESEVVTGGDLLESPQEDLPALLSRTKVFARVSPDQKVKITDALRASGHFVAVTGDGVNDAPALRAANVGVAMGRSGTDVAREASVLVISDDDFSTIVAGIEEGRIAYDNIRKVIYLLVSTGAAELVLMGMALATGLPLPLLPVQILWLNLVTNGIQDVALAFESGEGKVLERSPRSPREPIFNRLMVERTLVAAVAMGGIGFASFYYMLEQGWEEVEARNALLLLLVLFENFHIGNCRSETKSAFTMSPLKSPILVTGAVMAFSLHIAMMHIPAMQYILETDSVTFNTFISIAAIAFLIIPILELHKWIWQLRFGQTQ